MFTVEMTDEAFWTMLGRMKEKYDSWQTEEGRMAMIRCSSLFVRKKSIEIDSDSPLHTEGKKTWLKSEIQEILSEIWYVYVNYMKQ